MIDKWFWRITVLAVVISTIVEAFGGPDNTGVIAAGAFTMAILHGEPR